MRPLFLFIFLFIFLINNSLADESGKTLIVGIKPAPPYIINKDNSYEGVCIDLWDKISNQLNFSYEFKEYNLPGLLDAVEQGKVDISINPLTVTSERLKRFGFTQPFYVTNLGIATKAENESTLSTFLRNFFSYDFLKIVAFLFAIILIFGLIVWLIERKDNPDQFHKGFQGIGDGIWWSAVTMTTVGYGDKTPRSGLGRTFSIIWMFIAVVIVSSFTATIASSLTIHRMQSEINSLEDLRRSTVGTLKGSAPEEFLKDYHILFKEYNSVDTGLQDIEDRKLQAFVFDETILRYRITQNKLEESIIIIPSAYSKEYFSFASNNHSLLNKINPILIDIIESTNWRDLLDKYDLEYRK